MEHLEEKSLTKKSLFNQLKKDAGISDSYVEYIELFVRKIEHENYSDEDVKKMSSMFNINVNNYAPEEIKKCIRGYYIFMVYQQVELFCSNAEGYIKEYCIEIAKKEKHESNLNYLYNQLVDKNNKDNLLLLICDYYRLVRNQYAHSSKDQTELKALQNKLRKVQEKLPQNIFAKINPKFDYNSITFDDFLAYTYSFKEISNKITDSIAKSYSPEKIANEIREKYKNRSKSEKVNKMIKNYIRLHFFTHDEELVKKVIAILYPTY